MLGKRMREIREASGLTSGQVSTYLNLNLKGYIMMENDEVFVNGNIIEKLSQLYGCSERTFYQKDEEIHCLNLKNIDTHDLERVAHITKMVHLMTR